MVGTVDRRGRYQLGDYERMNAFALGAAAVGIGFVVWFGLIIGGFAFMKFFTYLNNKATDKQTFWATLIALTVLSCYLTGMTILRAAGAT